jgi:hypothetical protein
MPLKYEKPFHVKDGIIFDNTGKEVRLWGVNYYTPFHHNYYNLLEMGVNHCKAIDRDLEDLKKMGVDFMRLHLIDRDITDRDGNIVENDHIRVFDYLVERLFQEHIFLMITPVAWWNSTANEYNAAHNYARWQVGENQAFGFSNFYEKHCLIWHEEALNVQERYFRALFSRKNQFSKKTLYKYDNIVVIEPVNEPDYPSPDLLEKLKNKKAAAPHNNAVSFMLLDHYKDYLGGKPESREKAEDFCFSLVERYMQRFNLIIREYFGSSVLICQIFYEFTNRKMMKILTKGPHDCISLHGYIPCVFDSCYTDRLDFCAEAEKLRNYYLPLKKTGKGLISYEWSPPSTLLGYPMALIAKMFTELGVQLAAYFTYTPRDLAAYNPGWLVEYLNLYHTPSRAAAFIAAGAIFRTVPHKAPAGKKAPEKENYFINAQGDLAAFWDSKILIASSDLKGQEAEKFFAARQTPVHIIARKSNQYVESPVNSVYFLTRINERELRLEVLPDQFYVADPFRGRAFFRMANRYVNTNREPVVSRLREDGDLMKIQYPGFKYFKVERLEEGILKEIPVNDGMFHADPGVYKIIRRKK